MSRGDAPAVRARPCSSVFVPVRPCSPAIKVCGVTRPDDADLCCELGADFLGLNFYPGSPRCVTLDQAREIAAAAASRAGLVGVFVNRPAAEAAEIAEAVGLDLLQFSGDEEPAEIGRFSSRGLKVFRSGGDPGAAALALYDDFWGVLFDARHGRLYGGTGQSWPFAAVARIAARRRVFVAGGLGPGTARAAATASGAWGIDVCSRVESAAGIKERTLLERLFEEVRHGQGTAT